MPRCSDMIVVWFVSRSGIGEWLDHWGGSTRFDVARPLVT